MSFTYDETLTAQRDRVRFYIGDTVELGHVVEDEEIDGLLAQDSNEFRVGCLIATSQAAKAARALNAASERQVGRLRLSELRDEVQRWKDVCAMLEEQGGSIIPAAQIAGVTVVGTTKTEQETLDEDDDYKGKRFEGGKFPVSEVDIPEV